MLQRLIAAYRRFSHLPRSKCRSASLNVVLLETRLAPAVAADYVPLMQPPTVVVVAPPQTVAPPPATACCARPDLFGVGEVAKPDEQSEWDEILNDEAPAAPPPQPEQQVCNEVESDAEGTVVIEGEVYLPYVD